MCGLHTCKVYSEAHAKITRHWPPLGVATTQCCSISNNGDVCLFVKKNRYPGVVSQKFLV